MDEDDGTQLDLGMSEDYWRGIEDGLEMASEMAGNLAGTGHMIPVAPLLRTLELVISEQKVIRIVRLMRKVRLRYFEE